MFPCASLTQFLNLKTTFQKTAYFRNVVGKALKLLTFLCAISDDKRNRQTLVGNSVFRRDILISDFLYVFESLF